VSAALEGTFPTFPGTGTICRRTDDPALDTLFGDGALLHDYLTAVDEGAHLYKWNPAEVKSSIAPGTASLHFASTLPANAGVQMLEILFPMLRKAIGAGNDSDTMLLQVAVLGLKAGTGGRRDLLRAASDALRPSLATFLNRLIPGSSACAQSASASSLPCGVRVLVDAAYEPIMAYVSEPSPGNAERKELTQQILERLDALDPLGRSPLLFDVGPGATMLTGLGKKSLTYHFTLVDKYGLALRWGDRREWQLGIFVGGFVDALVQKLSGTNDVVSYWLSGGTFGVRQFSKDFPVGLEMYAASANPFDLGRFKDNIGFATGLNALVPIDMLFNSSK
jgi:hypothetical protein